MTSSAFPVRRALSIREHRDRPYSTGNLDRERGTRRLARWQATAPFDSGDYFARRLAADDLSRETLCDLLAETAGSATDGDQPPWAIELAECFSSEGSDEPRLVPPKPWKNSDAYPFWALVEPIARRAAHALSVDLEELARAHPGGPLAAEKIEELVIACLPWDLLQWPFRTLVLELNIARLSGRLAEDDPQKRFREFTQGLKSREVALELFRSYPVLARQLIERVEVWKETTFELLERLCQGWRSIQLTFEGSADAGLLKSLTLEAGDKHRGGRSVALLEFASGFRLVYKPRSLSIDLQFQELLETTNGWGFRPSLRRLVLLDCGGHGWLEYLAACPCRSVTEVRRFYQRQGAYLALLYILCATDIHFENLIAVGEHPFIVDLESLMQPGAADGDPLASDLLRGSIVEVGLLPVRNWENASSPGLDVSGLGGPDGQLPPRPEPYWADSGTDEMRYSRRLTTIESRSQHRPKLEGAAVAAIEFTDEIIEGFGTLYRLALAHREEMLADKGPILSFAQHEVRVLLRSTSIYGLMLRESFHPDFLRDSLDRDRFFDKLWKQVPQRPFLHKVIGAEQEALRRGDIPIFMTHPTTRALKLDSGKVLDGFFVQSSLEHARERIEGFSEKDLKKQVWFIRASMAILSSADPERDTEPRARPASEAATGRPRATLMQLAERMADQLCEQALVEEGTVRWIGLQPTIQGAFKIAFLGNNLYSGQAGVTLFLAYLGKITGELRYEQLAQRSCSTILGRLDEDQQVGGSLGAFEGLGGIIYMLAHLAQLWQDDSLRSTALDLVVQVSGLIEQDEQMDIVGGSAGAIATLAALYRTHPEETILTAMIRCGERLIERAMPMSEGCGWRTTYEGGVPLAGFSHGVAGIAVALFELFAASGQERFRDQAREAIRYERSLFCRDHENWADLRSGEVAYDQVNWCHGAPGIALARALVLRHEGHEGASGVREELRAAVRTTLEHGFGRNHSLCHGDLGNVDALLWANSALAEPDLQSEIDRLTVEIAEDIDLNGGRCGLPMEVETPGLMVGLAGIGYGLLRLAAPSRVPSVLGLAPPPPM